MQRRRIAAVGSLLAVALGIGYAIASSGGGGNHQEPRSLAQPGSSKPKEAKPASPAVSVSRAGWMPHPGPVPFLMYHVIGDPKPGAPFPDLFVSVADFKRQMDYLDKQGYQAVTQSTIEDGWRRGAPVPRKPIVLTFDDGYLGQYTDALPILRRHGWVGTLNLKAMGSDLNPGEVRKMIAAGWELAAHTIHHLDLTTLASAQLKTEVAGSRAILRRRFGVPVDDFCYPAGRYNPTVVAAVKRAGYRGATTTNPGLASKSEPLTLKRIRVNRTSGLSGFVSALGTAGASTAAATGGD